MREKKVTSHSSTWGAFRPGSWAYFGLLKHIILTQCLSVESRLSNTALPLLPSNARIYFLRIMERDSPLCHLSPDPLLIVSVSKVAWLLFDVQTPSSSQRRLTAGAEREADGPRQDAANLTSLSPFQVLWFNQPLPHKLLWSTFEIMVSAQ